MVGGMSCRFGSEGGSLWLVELSHIDGAATLSSSRGDVVGSGEGQEAKFTAAGQVHDRQSTLRAPHKV